MADQIKTSDQPPIDPSVIELREMLQRELGEKFVRLYHFGSRIEGRADPESDYDLVCITTVPLTRDEEDYLLERQLDIQMDRGVLFDLHYYCEEQLRTGITSFSPFIQDVREKGILV